MRRHLPTFSPFCLMGRRFCATTSTTDTPPINDSTIPHICMIASHHIYNDEKKEYIILEAHNKNLSGVYLFGKPGRIVVEGTEADVKMYSKIIRSWKWQKCIEMADVLPSHVWLARSAALEVNEANARELARQHQRHHPPPEGEHRHTEGHYHHDKLHGHHSQHHHVHPHHRAAADNNLQRVPEFTEASRIFEQDRFVEVASEAALRDFLEKRHAKAMAEVLARPFNTPREVVPPH